MFRKFPKQEKGKLTYEECQDLLSALMDLREMTYKLDLNLKRFVRSLDQENKGFVSVENFKNLYDAIDTMDFFTNRMKNPVVPN